jgi:hypothetical protein
MRFTRQIALLMSAQLLAACGGAETNSSPTADDRGEGLCRLLPRAEAERIMGTSLTEHTNSDSMCSYDATPDDEALAAKIITGGGVDGQCIGRNVKPLDGIGEKACLNEQEGFFAEVVFGVGDLTLVVMAPDRTKATEAAMAIVRHAG